MKKVKNRYTCDVSYLQRMPAGIPGDVSRKEGAYVEARVFDATNPPASYGIPLVVDAGSKNMRHVMAGDLASAIYGFLVRPFPTSNINTTDGLGTSTPNTQQPADVLKKGYLNVVNNNGSAALNAPVYVRIANPSGAKVVGGIEAANDIGVTAAAMVGTGNATAGTLSATDLTPAGVYTVKMLTATTFDVLDAAGDELLHNGANTVQQTLDNGLSFKITAGVTPAVAGDTIALTVADNTIVVPNCVFMGPADSSGNVEIAYKI